MTNLSPHATPIVGRMSRVLSHLVAAGILCFTLAGCGVPDAYQSHQPPRSGEQGGGGASSSHRSASRLSGNEKHPTPYQLQVANQTGEIPSPAPRVPRAVGDPSGERASPKGAVVAFATRFINWSAGELQGIERSLADQSVSDARALMLQAAADPQTAVDLQAAGISNSGHVVAVVANRPTRGAYLVITRERTGTDGPTFHVTIARVARMTNGGYVVSGWNPQS